ncbi:MAG: DUF1761 domain-containing protein [Candidatus Jacksonbacteria bacterium]|jgi:hypothetical protein|nr:DUF1761 domain-containing protein [Candidatus Jacksonbacteria bacterium]MBT4472330.1 DUF1761 domain-containing protein [Bacteroidota bacterium]MBT6034419.1 DUF1761 domain-containing protein [Candidatus Jacksonbacteria bacterium]MBT6301660.1 DUF1761 domain-containing protein [Candidatus Jacksonbacteria bacterium]MBT6757451.1 DUF1761 domain-containing protein [Candidatus Jacksonbacteria bacterium]
MPQADINLWAVLAAAVLHMVIGAFWYSPVVFGKTWMALTGKTMEDAKNANQTKNYIISLVSAVVLAYVLAHFVQYLNAATFVSGLQVGLWIGIGFVATTGLAHYLWEGRPHKLYLLNTVYSILSLALMGGILAIW